MITQKKNRPKQPNPGSIPEAMLILPTKNMIGILESALNRSKGFHTSLLSNYGNDPIIREYASANLDDIQYLLDQLIENVEPKFLKNYENNDQNH